MHDTARMFGALFIKEFWQPHMKRILDIGSMDVNGTLRDYRPAEAEYVGVDLEPGPGVDVVSHNPPFLPFDNDHFDLVVSTSCFEHDNCFWMTWLEAMRVLAPGGVLYVSAPSNGVYHAYPRDSWRFYPDAGLALVDWGKATGLDSVLIESFIGPKSQDGWEDAVMVFSKNKLDKPPSLFYLVEGCRDRRSSY